MFRKILQALSKPVATSRKQLITQAKRAHSDGLVFNTNYAEPKKEVQQVKPAAPELEEIIYTPNENISLKEPGLDMEEVIIFDSDEESKSKNINEKSEDENKNQIINNRCR